MYIVYKNICETARWQAPGEEILDEKNHFHRRRQILRLGVQMFHQI